MQALNGETLLATAMAVAQAVGPLLALGLLVPQIISFWGTRSAAAWLFLGLALAGLVGAELAGEGPQLRLNLASVSYVCLAAGLALQQLALRQTSLPAPQVVTGASLNDAQRLGAAFAHTVAAMVDALRNMAGAREVRHITERSQPVRLHRRLAVAPCRRPGPRLLAGRVVPGAVAPRSTRRP